MRKGKDGIYYRLIKRLLDILIALILIIPASLIVLICCILIKIETRGPVFFIQQRPGKNGKIFSLYKLRTMIVETERDGIVLSDIQRITRVGKIIRACSFDELPQLINVFKGDMSFIGPRPLLVQYLNLYSSEQARRHEVLPGITGWAQVSGRNLLKWEEKFQLDVWYVDNVSFILDVKIIFLTFKNLMQRRGINADSNETMKLFTGSTSSEECNHV